ncbi:C2H2 type zinc finger domain protein [Taphrina deformans PYCC 5710]|uniref:C2H2 type zinc finger domain protein n=1 Tax=Taphrina deformans (strain PYCC 5710 / ATCC 11124 / CBS 356.35 / IMI 108563 / JCM 9778 / NBRC 8474) TaxID=1097556 RepID=R4XFM3_TAPDE|nr:C2H2 type zinc finger domain protein [Taphrina deformans PYCC 5710]|eukprot:CCG83287.1 C2H2 type zinc finger domain protein [Taphrina deformans PYCC 5710]
MESTLAVADAAYNSGRRSRSTSFHSQQQPEGREGMAVDGHDARSVLSPNVMNTFNSNIFHSHRRHASDLSDISVFLPNNDSDHAVDSGNPLQRDHIISHSRSPSFTQHGISPSLTTIKDNFEDDGGGLDEAFNASLFMSEDYPRSMDGNRYYAQNPLFPPSDLAYQDSFLGGTGYGQGGTNNMAILSGQDLASRYGTTGHGPERPVSQDAQTFDDLSLYDDSALLQASLNHMHGTFPSYGGGQALTGHAQSHPPNPTLNLEYGHQPSSSQIHSPHHDPSLQPHESLQSPQSALLGVPGVDGLRQPSLEVHSPYPDSVTYEGGPFDEQRSPSVDHLTLSRTNSYNSQFQPSFEAHLASAPTSPYPSHMDYGNTQLQSPIPNYDPGLNNGFPISTPQYGFLQPQPHVSMAGQEQYMHRASLMIPGATAQNVFDPPDISINPPSPGHGSFANRADLMSYPFNQQVPIITTTPVTSHRDASQHVESPGCLQVDKSRGRSNSDSRLMVQQNLQRSRSHSSQGSSSSGRARSRSGTPGVHHKHGSSRIAKPLDHHRRASWSSARDQVEDEYEEGASQTPGKQKNPATFICPVEGCHKAFTRAYNLRSHQRTHTNERPFLCESCGKGFARQHDRKRHEKLHTNEKPFSCPGCKKKFARMDALSRHFKSETGKDCIIGNPEYEHFLLEGGDGEEEPEEE